MRGLRSSWGGDNLRKDCNSSPELQNRLLKMYSKLNDIFYSISRAKLGWSLSISNKICTNLSCFCR